MSYTDEWTEKEIKKLEARLSKEYKKAYAEMVNKCAEYFEQLEVRYQAQAKYGNYSDDELELWYQGQVQRGEQWKAVRDDMAYRMVHANEIASDYINNTTPKVYAQNGNYEAYSICRDNGVSGNFRVINEEAVRNIATEAGNYTEFKTVRTNPQRDYEWNGKQIQNAVMSAILQGKTPAQTTDAFMVVMKRNRTSAIRNARTAMTSAQNAGRVSAMERAQDIGIDVQKKWVATNDERTRFSHAMLNGQIRKLSEKFSNGLEHPADSNGAPREVYNCRCTLEHVYPKYDAQQSNEKYSDWLNLSEEEQKADLKAYREWQKEMQSKVAEGKEYKPDNQIITDKGARISSARTIVSSRNSSNGKPNAINVGAKLNNRQSKINNMLKEEGDDVIIKKKDVNMKDLASLTAYNGCEYAMFTRKQERMIVRGSRLTINKINTEYAKELADQGWRWSGHTHYVGQTIPSDGDKKILKVFGQDLSVIYDAYGSIGFVAND